MKSVKRLPHPAGHGSPEKNNEDNDRTDSLKENLVHRDPGGYQHRDISEKEKERMSRHDDTKKHAERIRNESSEKEKVKQDTVRHEGGLTTVARRED